MENFMPTRMENQPPGVQIYETYQSDGQDESFSTHTLIYQHKKEKKSN